MTSENKSRFGLRDILWFTTICALTVGIYVTWLANVRIEREIDRTNAGAKFGPEMLDQLDAYKQFIGEEVRFERDPKGQLQAFTKNGDRMHWEYPKGGPVERVVTDENGVTTRTRAQ
jgi:hypothetical protein